MIKDYFLNHIDHIIGVSEVRSGQFGPVTVYTSDLSIENIAKKIIGNHFVPSIQPYVITNQAIQVDDKNLQKSLSKTKTEAQIHPPSSGYDMIPFDELQKKYSTATEAEIKAWAFYQKDKLFSISQIGLSQNGWNKYIQDITPEQLNNWVKDGIMCYDGYQYIPSSLFYSGNIYDKINKVESNSTRIIDVIGQSNYDLQLSLLKQSVPEVLKLNAVQEERLYISPIDPFCQNILITELSDSTIFDEPVTLQTAFLNWLDTAPQELFKNGSSEYEITNYYIGNKRFKKDTEETERVEIRRRAQQDAIHLFQKFLFEAVTRIDQQIIEQTWNREFNAFKEYDYNKIPVGMEINKWFKNSLIDPRKTLWDGVKFLSANGSGIIAFDVGVGKTMASILAMAQELYTGQCKRPLVIVPNPTYAKWIEECIGSWKGDKCTVNGILPQFRDRINSFHNLGTEKFNDAVKSWPKDYTITFCTYEALENIGFSYNAISQLKTELFTILNQGELKERDQSKLGEKIDGILGSLALNTKLNFDDLGFDYIICDEAHNFRKIFTRVKSRSNEDEDNKQGSPYQLSSGEPSTRGLKLFAMCHYVLKQNNMRNVVLLTATPFTNSPLEIYSMLSLVAYKHLQNRGIDNLIDFFDKFINEEVELSVTSRGSFEPRSVIKTFNNRILLQNIIFSSIIYVTGEEAKVPRPNKIVYPLLKDANGMYLTSDAVVDTALPPTELQRKWLREISLFANEEYSLIDNYIDQSRYDKYGKLPGRDLIAINLAKNCTLSPYLMAVGGKKEGVFLEDNSDMDSDTYIESSPKLKYVMECIKTVKKHHEDKNEPISGQVIYMNLGVDYFDFIKQYLIDKIGFSKNEVEIIASGISLSKKEAIKKRFLNGEVKVLIGSGTIKEGIDLQNKSTVLYNVVLDWNPTDIKQLEGRIYRQGNQHSYVRIVNPLLENSLDVFIFQKLEEKTSRINDIWYRKGRGNVLNLDELDPKELKLGLMTDPKERVKAIINLDFKKLETEKLVAESNLNKITGAKQKIDRNNDIWEQISSYYQSSVELLDAIMAGYKADRSEPELSESKIKDLDRRIGALQKLLDTPDDTKGKINRIKRAARERINEAGGYDYDMLRLVNRADEFIKSDMELKIIDRDILKPKGLTIADDLQPIIDDFTNALQNVNDRIDKTKSDEHFNTLYEAEEKASADRNKESRSIEFRVQQFTKHNHLLSCLKDIHICSPDNPMIVEKVKKDDNRIRIAKAKAKALLILQLQQKQLAA